MPPAYLARVDPKAQERHARAVAVYAEQSENGNSSQLEETHVVSCIPDLTVFDPRDDTVTFIRGQDEPGVLISMLESLVHRAGERELVRADIFTSMDTALCANLLDYSPKSVVSFDEANSTLDADELALATKVRGTEGSIASATPIKVRENGAPQAWKLRVAATNVVGDFALQRIAAYVGLFGLNITEGRLVTLQDDRAKIRGKPARVTVTSLTIAWPRAAAGWPFVRNDDAAPLTPGGHKRGTLGPVFCSELARCTKHLDDRAWELGLCTPLGITRAELLWAFATAIQPSLAREGGPHEFAISRVYEMLEQAEILPLAGELASAFLARFDPAGPGGSAPDESANRLREEAFTSTVQAIRARAEATVDDPAARRVLHAIADCALATTRTNVFVPGRQALALRIDSSLMLHPSSPKAAGSEKPYTTIFVAGRRFAGFHVRYRDVARGGLRLVVPSSRDVHAMELQRCHDEAQTLALAQQLKNKDIPEGGSKAVVLVEPHRATDKDLVTRRCVRAFVNSLLDLSVPHASFAETVVDRHAGGRSHPELLFLGPDENIIPEDIEWIYSEARRRGHPSPASFMSSKANAGINHKTYGVTSEGVAVFLDIALRRCGLHPSETGRPFTVKLSGGPSGDVAGNALKVLHRMYLGDEGCKVVGMCDGTAVAEDPNGLSWSELLRLVNSGLPLAEYDTNALSPTGVLVLTDNNPEGVRRRNTFPLKVRADAFLPAGGRPGTINADNVGGFFHLADDGSDRKVPCCPLIVEGANLYITPEARDAMWRTAGVTVVKDSSANKSGVTTSSFEVLASLLLTEEEFVDHKESIVHGVLERLREQAALEAELLFDEREKSGMALPKISERLSAAIIRLHDLIEQRLHEGCPDAGKEMWQRAGVQAALFAHLPEGVIRDMVKKEPERWDAVPLSYRASIVASRIASRAIYSNGLGWAERVESDDALMDAVLAWVDAA